MCINLLAEMMETCSGFGDRVADWLQSVAVLRQVAPGDNDASCIIYETSPTIIDATIDLLGQSESVAVLMGLLDTTGYDYYTTTLADAPLMNVIVWRPALTYCTSLADNPPSS